MIMNRMHRSDRGWYTINNRADEAEDTDTADVYIYAEIGDSFFGDSVSAADFVREVAGLEAKQLNLHLNSPGGDVYDGIAIANVLRQHPADVTVYVDGLAASAASFIAMAGDEVVMGKGAELMIHDSWGICIGNSEDMATMSGQLDHVSNNIASMYVDKAGGTTQFWRDAMLAETWYTAEEAVEAGLADRISDNKKAEKAKAKFDLSIFNHAGRSNAPAPPILARLTSNRNTSIDSVPAHLSKGEYVIPASKVQTFASGGQITGSTGSTTQTSPAEPVRTINPTTEGADTMSDTLTTGLRERLGIPDDAELDDDGLLAAVDEALDEQQPENSATELPAGTVIIEQAILDDLRASADLGRQAREQQLASERNALVDAAIQDGRIAPSRRDHWVQALVADPGAKDVLTGLAAGMVPFAAKGYTGGVEASTDDDLYSKLYGSEAR
jgi:ATP-dependent protease ClpP protease subunit